MTMTDPIADMLTRIRNANTAMHDDVSMPSSKIKEALAQVLHREGYISFSHQRDVARPRPHDRHEIRRRRASSGVKRISTPGLRGYTKAGEIPVCLGGLGVAVVSTSKE